MKRFLLTFVLFAAVGVSATGQTGRLPTGDSARAHWLQRADTIRTRHCIVRTDVPSAYRATLMRHVDGYHTAVNEIFNGIGL